MYYVYGHYRSSDKTIFYVGVAKSKRRFISKYSRNEHWRNIVNKNGFYYQILFESLEWVECLNKEKELIYYYGRIDIETGILCNMTDGGEGCYNLSEESKLKISNKIKGFKHSNETKLKMSENNKGKILSEETKSKMSKSHKKVDKSYLFNRVFSEEHRKNISLGKKGVSIGVGKILTQEHKKAISNGFKPKFNDNELKEIIEMYDNNISIRKISLKFNSNHTTIKRYINIEIEKL